MNNQKGFSAIAVIIIVAILGIGGYLYLNRADDAMDVMEKASDLMMKDDETHGSFAELDEPEGTPAELSNETLDELDSLMNEIEDATSGEDLSDL